MNFQFTKRLIAVPLIFLILFGVLGVLFILWPTPFVHILPPILGIVLLILGAFATSIGLTMRKTLRQAGFATLIGLASIVIGLIFLIKNNVSIAFIGILFGLFVLVTAFFSLSRAIQAIRTKESFLRDLIVGLINAILGGLLLINPMGGMTLWVRITGAYLVVLAVSAIISLLLMAKEVDKGLKQLISSNPPEEKSENLKKE